MKDFYKNLWLKGMGRLEALRAARLAMRHKNRMENDGNGLPATWGGVRVEWQTGYWEVLL